MKTMILTAATVLALSAAPAFAHGEGGPANRALSDAQTASYVSAQVPAQQQAAMNTTPFSWEQGNANG